MANTPERSRTRDKRGEHALKNRQELTAARLSRRDLGKMGLMTSTGVFVAKRGLSAQARDSAGALWAQTSSPPTAAFVDPLPIMPIKQPVSNLTPPPTVAPNVGAGEGRTRPHQALGLFPPVKLYQVRQRAGSVFMSPDLPAQTIWGYDGRFPGPTYVARYGEPILIRNRNKLPTANGGFGIPSVSTHLHNGHTPSESDGFPVDYFGQNQFYDQHYPNALAGFSATHPPIGDINETLGTLWYHDHRVEYTAQNVYKGLAGFYLLFNHLDTGEETTGFHLPSFPQFDIPMAFADRVFDPSTGLLSFDHANLGGILGDKFLVNGKIQPVLQVHPRRYRFRWLNTGPSRFCWFFLTDLLDPAKPIPLWRIASDGNLLPQPRSDTNAFVAPGERTDVIVDFSQFAPGTALYIENRLEQTTGQGVPNEEYRLTPPGQGQLFLKIEVSLPGVPDDSAAPANIPGFYQLPDATEPPRVVRNFQFGFNLFPDKPKGLWTINGQPFSTMDQPRFRVKRNSVEHWLFQNVNTEGAENWQHPFHVHFEEFQLLGLAARKDVIVVQRNQLRAFFRFRDFVGRYAMHCHNTIHEDHSMMLRWDIDDEGDTITDP